MIYALWQWKHDVLCIFSANWWGVSIDCPAGSCWVGPHICIETGCNRIQLACTFQKCMGFGDFHRKNQQKIANYVIMVIFWGGICLFMKITEECYLKAQLIFFKISYHTFLCVYFVIWCVLLKFHMKFHQKNWFLRSFNCLIIRHAIFC